MDFQKFRVQLGKSPLLVPFVSWVIWLVPAAEIVIVGLLIFKRLQLLGLYASFTLMCLFTGYIIVILNYSEYIPCSCGGILQNMNWQQHLVFNIIFTVIGCCGVLLYPAPLKRTFAKEGEAENLDQSRL
jgi:hypothetical protein